MILAPYPTMTEGSLFERAKKVQAALLTDEYYVEEHDDYGLVLTDGEDDITILPPDLIEYLTMTDLLIPSTLN